MLIRSDNDDARSHAHGFPIARRTQPLLIACGVATLLLATTSPAHADEVWPELTGWLSINPREAYPGDTVQVTGSCWLYDYSAPASKATLSFVPEDRSVEYASLLIPVLQKSGAIGTDVIIPPDARPGPHEISWACLYDGVAHGGPTEREIFTILARETEPPSTSAPSPGGPVTGAPTTGTPSASAPLETSPSTPGSGAQQNQDLGSRDLSTDELAATGFPGQSLTLTLIGALAAVGAGITMLVRRRIRPGRS